jgi:hypothetical protein
VRNSALPAVPITRKFVAICADWIAAEIERYPATLFLGRRSSSSSRLTRESVLSSRRGRSKV